MKQDERASVKVLLDWLDKRGLPDSGIRYETGSHSNTNGIRHRLSSVTLHGSDADFVAKHFHGQGARDLASAIRTALDLSPLTERIERLEAVADAAREVAEHADGYELIGDVDIHPLNEALRTLSETQP